MTEAEWLAGEKPLAIVDWIRTNASPRKLRLLGCACLRRYWSKLQDGSRGAILIAERFADGKVTAIELGAAETAARAIAEGASDPALGEPVWDAVYVASVDADSFAYGLLLEAECYDFGGFPSHRADWKLRHEPILEIFGNPFHPIVPDTSWITPAVASLTQTIYEEAAFDRMAELADALEQAGCTNANILGHCRGPGTHVRGCWVVDLILAKV